MCFFFQAEDGIRDLVRSRELGDVYKGEGGGVGASRRRRRRKRRTKRGCGGGFGAVYDKHLTLPAERGVLITGVGG